MDTTNGHEQKNQDQQAFFNSVLKKGENITTALYMVTDYIDKEEALRVRLHILGLDVLNVVHDFVSVSPFEYTVVLKELNDLVREVVSLLTLGKTVGLVSVMNADILIREYKEMNKVLEEYIAQSSDISYGKNGVFTLNDDMLGPALSLPPQLSLPEYVRQAEELSLKKLSTPIAEELQKKSTVLKKTPEAKPEIQKTDLMIKTNRRNTIIKYIKDNKEATIKDISTVVMGCSEKTIQRELLSLVTEGILKKTGEKRWSRYSLL